MDDVTVAAIQMVCSPDRAVNLNRAEVLIRTAAAEGASLILLPELFESPYFCKEQNPRCFGLAEPVAGHPTLNRMRALAAELRVVLPVSIFERAGQVFFNSLAVIDSDGGLVGIYRKSHIPDGHGYQEKYYFSPGDTGFQSFTTSVGKIGCAISWDQWFPEAARVMALKGADILLYPTAVGTRPPDSELESRDHWTRVMQGHAAANLMPVMAANRVGYERGETCDVSFYGSSFITGVNGEILVQAGCFEEAVVTARLDLETFREKRAARGVFRDRRPELYNSLLTLDGVTS